MSVVEWPLAPLAEACAFVLGAMGGRGDGALLIGRTSDGELELGAGDGAAYACVHLPYEWPTEQAIAVEARIFCEFIRKLDGERLRLTAGERLVVVETAAALGRFPYAARPARPAPAAALMWRCDDPQALARALLRAAGSCRSDDDEPALASVRVAREEGRVSVVGTTGYRLAWSGFAEDGPPFEWLVPVRYARGAAVLAEAAARRDVAVAWYQGEPGVELRSADGRQCVSVPVLAGRYPHVAPLLDRGGALPARLARAELERALGAAQVVGPGREQSLELELGTDGMAKLRTRAARAGAPLIEASIPLLWSGERRRIGFYAGDLGLSLRHLAGAEIALWLRPGEAPVPITGASPEREVFVVMPVRL